MTECSEVNEQFERTCIRIGEIMFKMELDIACFRIECI